MIEDLNKDLSLGELLRQTRLQLNFSCEDILEKIAISPKHLKALEAGNFYELPAQVYTIAYLKSLAKLYNLETSRLIRLYEEEKSLANQPPDDSRIKPQVMINRRLTITPKTVATIFGVLVFATAAIYLVFQIRNVTAAPQLSLDAPSEGQQITNSYIGVAGRTDSGSTLSINNQIVPLETNGSFNQNIFVAPGENQIVVRSENRFNKSTVIERRIVVAQTQAQATSTSQVLGTSIQK